MFHFVCENKSPHSRSNGCSLISDCCSQITIFALRWKAPGCRIAYAFDQGCFRSPGRKLQQSTKILMHTMQTKLQLLGDATFKVTKPENKIIIVDPWLIDNPYIPKGLENQDTIDLILVTHGHEDHFDIRMKEIIKKTAPKIVANNICRWYLIEQNISEKL